MNTPTKLFSILPMAFLVLLAFLLLFFILVPIFKNMYRHQRKTNVIPTNWPIFGMVPGVLINTNRILDYATELLIQSHGTFMFKGPWFANMDMFLTTDPLDINHILSKNFGNYPKGDKFHKIFDILGDGILSADGKVWEISHKLVFSIFKNEGFRSMMETVIWEKVENGLLPVLEFFCGRGAELDLKDIFQRFAFDSVCKLLFDEDPESLSLDFPSNLLSKGFTDAEEAILLRHVTPSWFWKLQQILRFGAEKKYSDAWKNVDQIIYKWLTQKEKEYNNQNHEAEKFIFYAAIMGELKDHSSASLDPIKFLRDTMVSLMAAGKDTISSALSWFFYLLAKNPIIEEMILKEILTHLEVTAAKRWSLKELEKLVYLHGALCESLRLYPPVPFNHKSPLQPEILPSGHKVNQNTNIILPFYSMGRMKSIWGDDCMEFKPERWITSSGRIKHEPSYKFATFNAGPRACLGKNISFSQLKMVSTSIIYHYQVQLVEGHLVLPSDSMILEMKHGLMVRLNKRNG